jgi:cobalamin biosynthesis protein CbiG
MTGHLVAGIGFSSRANADELVDLITSTLTGAGFAPADLGRIVSIERRAGTGIAEAAARRLSAELTFLDHHDLAGQPDESGAASAAFRHLGVASVAEAAAARFGPLVAGKHKSAHATCALSRRQGEAF